MKCGFSIDFAMVRCQNLASSDADTKAKYAAMHAENKVEADNSERRGQAGIRSRHEGLAQLPIACLIAITP